MCVSSGLTQELESWWVKGVGSFRGAGGGYSFMLAPPLAPLPRLRYRAFVFIHHQVQSKYGAFVKLDGYSKDGLVHLSQMASFRVEDPTDVCKEGDAVYVKVI